MNKIDNWFEKSEQDEIDTALKISNMISLLSDEDKNNIKEYISPKDVEIYGVAL